MYYMRSLRAVLETERKFEIREKSQDVEACKLLRPIIMVEERQ